MKHETIETRARLASAGKGRPRGRTLAFAIVSLVLGAGALVPLVVDLAVSRGLSWSLYALGGVAMAWLILAPLFLARRRRIALSWLAAAVSVPAYLALAQAMDPGGSWLLPLGLPCAAIGLAGLGFLAWLWAYSGLHPLASVSLTLLALGLVSLGETAVTQAWLGDDPAAWIRNLVSLCLLGIGLLFGLFALMLGKFGAGKRRREGAWN